MKNKIGLLLILVACGVLVSGCTLNGKADGAGSDDASNPASSTQNGQSVAGKCTPGPVSIEGYGDKGKRLKNCFVEYPGEPTRQDKSYYVLEDICGQFTKEFVEGALGKSIVKTVAPTHSTLYNCKYETNDKGDYVLLVLDYLHFENQRKGNLEMGRRVEENSAIPMRNIVIWQGDRVNSIILALGDEKFISIHVASELGLTSGEQINFAANIAKQIKNYK
jgi:hypothetical protein